MKILMLSTDRNIFESGSAVQKRMGNYASAVEQLQIVVLGNTRPTERVNKLHILGLSRWSALWWQPSDKFDLVTSQDPFETGFISWRLARRLGAKLELQIHTDIGSPYFRRHSWLNRIRFWLARFLLPRANHIRVVSQRIKDFLVGEWHLPTDTIEIRPIAIDLGQIGAMSVVDKFNLRLLYPQKKNILMVGRLEPEKNLSLALRGFAEAIKILPSLNLVIVGTGQKEASLHALARRLGIAERVQFMGWVPMPISYYKSADLFLQTSDYEGYGMALVEAKMAGCPIVSTDVGVATEYGARLVDHNAESVAIGITKSLFNHV